MGNTCVVQKRGELGMRGASSDHLDSVLSCYPGGRPSNAHPIAKGKSPRHQRVSVELCAPPDSPPVG